MQLHCTLSVEIAVYSATDCNYSTFDYIIMHFATVHLKALWSLVRHYLIGGDILGAVHYSIK